MTERLAPVLRVSDGEAAALWYRQLDFEVVHRHQFEPALPRYLILRRDDLELHLSEHDGDAPTGSLVYLRVRDVDAVATRIGALVEERPWGRGVRITDPDGNRLRIGSA